MTLGQSLADARKTAGLDLDSLASKTNIRSALLREFESNNFINAGGDAYARGHLRSIARALSISADDLLDQYDQEHAHEERKIHSALVENNATFALQERKRLTNKQLAIYSGIGIFLLLLTSVIVNGLKQSASSPKPKPSPTASATPTKSVAPSQAATPNSYSSGSGVSVKLEAVNGSSWLFVSDKDGVTLYSGRAAQGQTFDFSSTEMVNLRIGNAGAVKLTVNGKEVPSLGGDGEVVNVSYGVNS
jgi:cytoskeletal protein RodZ